MQAPVNFDNLRDITGGDTEQEASLFASFLTTAHHCMENLRAAFAAADEVGWRHQAHAFKGVCMNMGAGHLSELCGQAQMDWRASTEEKSITLQNIENEYTRVQKAVAEQIKS